MTVTYTGVSQNLTATNVVYAQESAIKAMAQAVMISMAESNIDMLCDMPEEYPTKGDVELVFQGLHDQATDMILDCFDDLKERLLKELATKRYTARVKALRYDDNGVMNDVDVQLTFE
jgi:hypothetical protein